jgi:hypothetical protein
MIDRDHRDIDPSDLILISERMNELKDENLRLRAIELELRDSVLGLQAQIEELEHRFRSQSIKHAEQIASLKSSWSWRVGHTIVVPFSKLKSLKNK